jgi:uroporphyrinogen-III synthase
MSDLTDLKDVYYDVLAFFSPTGIKSLFKNFPDFEQNNTRIAVFGPTTQKEALDHGLRVDIMAPSTRYTLYDRRFRKICSRS